jgi:putative molybdopterin biosynthesis protein
MAGPVRRIAATTKVCKIAGQTADTRGRMPEYLTTKEIAELLRIKERKVYDLANSGSIPCTKATGKLLFPRDAIEEWLERRSAGSKTAGQKPRPNVFLGSHDPILDWALRESGCGIATYFDGSNDGLDRFEKREGIATGLHLYDPLTRSWNTPFIAERFAGAGAVLVEWSKRQRGLVIARGSAAPLREVKDLTGRSFAPRQEQSGSQHLFAHLLEEAGLSAGDLKMTAPLRTEVDAALAVLEGQADACFGLQSVASQYGLDFIPLVTERFDLLVDRHGWFEPPFQLFLDFCRSDSFARKTGALAGCDFTQFGTVHFNTRN